MSKVAEIKKALVAGGGFLGVALTLLLQAGNVLPDRYVPYAAGVLSFLTLVGVYQAKNKPAPDAATFDDGGKDA